MASLTFKAMRQNKLESKLLSQQLTESNLKSKNEIIYRAKVNSHIEKVRDILNDTNVESVIIEVPKQYINLFIKTMYEDELKEFNIKQLSENTFEISNKIVIFM